MGGARGLGGVLHGTMTMWARGEGRVRCGAKRATVVALAGCRGEGAVRWHCPVGTGGLCGNDRRGPPLTVAGLPAIRWPPRLVVAQVLAIR